MFPQAKLLHQFTVTHKKCFTELPPNAQDALNAAKVILFRRCYVSASKVKQHCFNFSFTTLLTPKKENMLFKLITLRHVKSDIYTWVSQVSYTAACGKSNVLRICEMKKKQIQEGCVSNRLVSSKTYLMPQHSRPMHNAMG